MGLSIIHEQTDIADNDIQDLVLYCQQAYYIQYIMVASSQ